MPLIDFWSRHPHPGIHPEDKSVLETIGQISWATSAAAKAHETTLNAKNSELQRKLHTNLYPQPFVGNIRRASVYILFGNPGLSVQDYVDELDTPAYAAQCSANLSGNVEGFGPLLAAAQGTGAYKYWNSTFKRLIKETAEKIGLSHDGARTWVLSQVAIIEAGAYHSMKFPVEGFAKLPSTRRALHFVRNHVMNRVENQECVVLVWRQAKLWALPGHPGLKERDRSKANGRYLLKEERKFLVEKLANVHRQQKSAGTQQLPPI